MSYFHSQPNVFVFSVPNGSFDEGRNDCIALIATATASSSMAPASTAGRQPINTHLANRSAARSLAFAASSCLFLGPPLVSRVPSSCAEIPAMPLTADLKAASFIFEGLLKPVIFRTNCSEAARISSSVAGGSKLNSVLMFRHIADLKKFDALAQGFSY